MYAQHHHGCFHPRNGEATAPYKSSNAMGIRTPTISLNLLINKEEKRVLFAESDRRFVETLLSFLTLPLGTVVRLLDKRSTVGCLDKLYVSIEQHLKAQHLQTSACKAMLLQPRSEAERACEDLLKAIDYLNPRRLYRCKNWVCYTKTHCLYSMVPGARCCCGQQMEEEMQWIRQKTDENISDSGGTNGVFLRGQTRFTISDDLHVTPVGSTAALLSFLPKIGIECLDNIEMKSVNVGRTEVKILELLRRSLVSNTPLTDVFLGNLVSINTDAVEAKLTDTPQAIPGREGTDEPTRIALKLLRTKDTYEIVFAEGGNDLVDLLFSFLTFPLGSVVKLLGKQSSTGCIGNLHISAEGLSQGGHMTECRMMLLDPKVAPHHSCANQLFEIEEMLPSTISDISCNSCYLSGQNDEDKCLHHGKKVTATLINPKLPNTGTEKGGGFAKSSERFMVSNEMTVMPLLTTSVFNLIKNSKFQISGLVEEEVTISEAEVN